jgi:glutamate-1-semialdehyde 2,1-aminomutase
MIKLLYDFGEKDARIFEEEFKDFLPDQIIDTHMHIYREGDKKPNVKANLYNLLSIDESYPQYTYEDFEYTMEKLFTSKKCSALVLGQPVSWIDYGKNNKYVSEVCKKNDIYGCYMLTANQENIPPRFFEDKYVGFKPYADTSVGDKAKDYAEVGLDVTLYSNMPETVLEFANSHRLIIVNDVPRADWLNDENNIREIIEICHRYPDIKMILAHAGRSYTYYDIKDSVEHIKNIDNLYFDLAMVNDIRVIETLIRKVGTGRILYATDLPVAGLKGKNVNINNKHYFVTKDRKSWSISYTTMNLDDFTFFVYEIVRAIKIAIENTGSEAKSVDKIFFGNISEMIDDIKRLNNIL